MKKTLVWHIKEKTSLQQLVILVLMLIPDSVVIILSAITAYKSRLQSNNNFLIPGGSGGQVDYNIILAGVVCTWILTLILTGTYKFNHATLVVFNLRMVIKRSFAYFFVLGFLSFLLKASLSRSVFLVMLVSGLSYLFIVRITIYGLILRPMILRKKVTSMMMIIGREKKVLNEYSDWLIANRTLGFTIASRLVCPEINSAWVNEFDKLLRLKRITEVLLLPGMESDPNFSRFIHYCEDLEIHVNWVPLSSGNLGYWLIPSPQEGIPFLTFEKSQISLPWRIVKRCFDLIFSISVLVLLSPVFIGIGISVLVSSGWPIFYSQTRIGILGKPFKFYKFRSMVKDADKMIEVQLSTDSSSRDSSKRADDPRITKVGRILRKYSLDELPQFLNVVFGSMSVVGPRPAVAKEVNQYDSIYERRLIAKPGITGPWQISGRSDLDLRTSVALDLNYLINWSFTRDLWIIISTIGAVFRGKGAY